VSIYSTHIIQQQLHCKKRLEIFPARESWVSDILAGDGNIADLFYRVWLTVACTNKMKRKNITREAEGLHVKNSWKFQNGAFLKVPKRENFLLAFFALSEPIWVGDLGTKEKKKNFSI
jgi:hypothetical protein